MIRLGMIGFGFIAQCGHAPFYISNPNIKIIGVADLCGARLEVASAYFPDAKLFSSGLEMLESMVGQVDVIDICTPPYIHYEMIVKAVSCGYHVICEKPLVADVNRAEKLIELAEEYSRVIYPCHNYRFSPVAHIAKKFISQGNIGIPQIVTLNTYRTTHAKGVPEWIPDWRRKQEFSAGGILMDHGPHSIYMICDFLDEPTPISVSCLTGNICTDEYCTEDTVQLNLKFSKEQQAAIFLSWASAYRCTRYLIAGTSGYIEIENDVVKFTHNNKVLITETDTNFNDPSHSNWFKAMFLDFERSLTAATFQIPLLEVFSVSATISASYASAQKSGEWVCVKQYVDDHDIVNGKEVH